MLWLSKNTTFNTNDCKDFSFEPGQHSVIKIIKIWKDQQNSTQVEWTDMPSDKYHDWVVKDCESSPTGPTVLLVMHQRLDANQGSKRGATALPYDVRTFKEACQRLFQHRSISALLARTSTTVFSYRKAIWEPQTPSEKGAPAIVYNFKSDTVSPTQHDDDLVLSVTHFIDKPITFGVMYGCTKETFRKVRKWSAELDELAFHPLMLPMVFFELERKRMIDVVDEKEGDLRQRIIDIPGTLKDQGKEQSEKGVNIQSSSERDCESIKLWIASSSLKNGLQSLKAQLLFMIEHSKALSEIIPTSGQDEASQHHNKLEATELVQSRLEEMIAELDSKVRVCEGQLEGTTLTTSMEWNYNSRKDVMINIKIAEASKKESSQMKAISMLGMIFLPGTFLSSLFSMSFFNWMPSDSDQKISPWIAVYWGITVILTASIIFGWRKWTRIMDKSAEGESYSVNKYFADDISSIA
ncbi:hypothetical protein F5B20DRAFT_557464 [Whalleya microplaca]|nr:hypothetical protein F5B20DRAFT_557464 [Whalleya microplaca]